MPYYVRVAGLSGMSDNCGLQFLVGFIKFYNYDKTTNADIGNLCITC